MKGPKFVREKNGELGLKGLPSSNQFIGQDDFQILKIPEFFSLDKEMNSFPFLGCMKLGFRLT